MRHYEIVVIIHPDRSDQVPDMLERYKNLIVEANGTIHRSENWGRRHFEYPINRIYKGHYTLLNIECNVDTLNQLKKMFRFNDAVIRNLIIKKDFAESEKSIIAVNSDKEL